MNTIFASKELLKNELLKNKNKFNKEEYDYLMSLLEREIQITNNIL